METKAAILKNLQEKLKILNESHHVLGLKTGTEVEDMGFDEIGFIKAIAGNLPLTVKIGGPEARNDIRQCIKIGVDIILAPMVETVYALTNFVKTVESIVEEMNVGLPKLAVNIESKTAVKNLDEMLHSKSVSRLYQATIGRSDLSKSMHLSVDDAEVINSARQAIKKLNRHGLVTSVGGGITMENISSMILEMPMNKINTRHVVFSNTRAFQKNPAKHLFHAMMFEKFLYQSLALIFPERTAFYRKRENVITVRMGNITLIEKFAGG
ncbi:MAG: HpcH/HpaI aldolase/citrate lyase family protein [Spirochaetia bacterium]|nr:HpcH/HpaI aldolase/citrate lyase family protein [Spirochaetia bacterium]